MLNEIINGKYKVFSVNFLVFLIINISQEEIIEKYIVNINLTTVSARLIFWKSKDYVEQVTKGCGIMWDGGIFYLKLKRFNLKSINVSKFK